jgi:serine/threonine-protein kinase HipA
MTEELVALLDGRTIGHVRRNKRTGKLSFAYEENWSESEDAYPLSLSMPLSSAEYGHAAIETFLWGLLPDNDRVIDSWAKRFQVSARNAFALLSNVGEDCAGAVQFVPQERLEAVLSGAEDRIEWLDDAGIAFRLKRLREDHAAWRLPSDSGQFSLAGAQPKTALLLENGKWAIPSGRLPTTHILKPPTGYFDGHAENEHICMSIAGALGMPTASSKVLHFEDEVAISVRRYDRFQSGNRMARVHQEDVCQALGILPVDKYQKDGGPGVINIVELLRENSSESREDVQTFVDAIAFNWLIAGTDAHAKNYSLLISGGARVRLAPLYDVASLLPYKEFNPHKMKLAMKIGGEYLLENIVGRHWERLAREVRLDFGMVRDRLLTMAKRLPDEANAAHAKAKKDGLDNPIIDYLVEALTNRAAYCARILS